MCQHSWYDKNRRHHGPKPNTRRARGLKRRDFGKKKKDFYVRTKEYDELPDITVGEWVGPPPEIPKNAHTQVIYVRIYNYYVNEFGLCNDKLIAMQNTMIKFKSSDARVAKAIKFAKYLLTLH